MTMRRPLSLALLALVLVALATPAHAGLFGRRARRGCSGPACQQAAAAYAPSRPQQASRPAVAYCSAPPVYAAPTPVVTCQNGRCGASASPAPSSFAPAR